MPFVLGAACALFGLYLRRNLVESPEYLRAARDQARAPVHRTAAPQERVLPGARPHHGRHHGVLHLQHVHADLPGQHGEADARPGDADLLHLPALLCLHAAALRRDLGRDRPPPGADVVRHPRHALHRAAAHHAVAHARFHHRAAADPGGARDRLGLYRDQRGGEGGAVPRRACARSASACPTRSPPRCSAAPRPMSPSSSRPGASRAISTGT